MTARAIVIFLAAILWSNEPAFANLTVMDIVEQVSQVNYTNYLDNMLYTHLGDNRGFGPEHDLARSNIYAEFESLGLDTSLRGFQYSGSTYYNVIGARYGKVRPFDFDIIGELFGNLKVDISVEQGSANFLKCFGNIYFRYSSLSLKYFKGFLQPFT
jgi:hypothetical protein